MSLVPSDIKVFRGPPQSSLFRSLGLIAFGAGLGLAVSSSALLLAQAPRSSVQTNVDFHFQMLNISTPRQHDKLMNIFVKWRYPDGADRCPYSPIDNNCIQYQNLVLPWLRNVTQFEQPGLPLGAEWERVALHICRHLYSTYVVSAVSVLVQVNGDGRDWVEAYEPSAHGATCTIGPPEFPPLVRANPLPDFEGNDVGPGQPKAQ